MTWLWILLIAIVVGGIIGYMTSGSKEGARRGAASFGIGCVDMQTKLALSVKLHIYNYYFYY